MRTRQNLAARWLCPVVLGFVLGATPRAVLAQQAGEIPIVSPADVRTLIGDHQGKVVVVNFWASWCPPCVEEFPELIRFYNDYGDAGVELMAVSMNATDEMEDVREFLGNYDATFPIYIAATQELEFMEGIAEDWYGEMPTTLVIDTEGATVHMHKRQVTYDELAGEVGALLP